MSEPKFTPGPWVARETPESSHQDWVVEQADEAMRDGRRHSIASLCYVGGSTDEANARLIAAAPDLYTACVMFVHAPNDPDALAAARAALATVTP